MIFRFLSPVHPLFEHFDLQCMVYVISSSVEIFSFQLSIGKRRKEFLLAFQDNDESTLFDYNIYKYNYIVI